MPKPKIGVSMLYCLGEPFNTMVQRLATVETSYVEVVDDGLHALNKKRVATLNEAAESRSLKFTVHCPFADINVSSSSKLMLNASLKRLRQSMAYANQLNAQLFVLHSGLQSGISPFYPGKDWEQNVQSIRLLHKTATEHGLTVAIENLPQKYGSIMKTPEDFKRLYQETSLNDVGIVLDVGHANLEAQTEPFLKQLPDKIWHMHLSDNLGEQDQHLGIGNGKIDWQQFARTLKKIGYDKTIMIESVYQVEESLKKLKQLFA
jgi:sugar phosphate isomerase/epimerase